MSRANDNIMLALLLLLFVLQMQRKHARRQSTDRLDGIDFAANEVSRVDARAN